MKLLIVESPTKARTLGRFLDKNYKIEATRGHIKDLPKSKLGVEVEDNFEPSYLVVPKQKKTISVLKKAVKAADDVYLATDPDREGEAIAAHVAEIIKDSKVKADVKRIVFHEITQSAVEEAIEHPRGVNKDLVEAQVARRVLDRLVGYKLSPLLWKKVRIGLSAGRVQTVALRLIVEKEREIEAFVPDEYWEISTKVNSHKQKENSEFIVSLAKINDKTAKVENEKQAGEIVADLEKSDYKVIKVEKREVKSNPYAPFTTSTLSQSGSRLFGWSSKKTMSVAQKLYEEGLITYHRTDSISISKQAVDAARRYITKEFGDNYVPEKPRIYKTKSKSAQEAHEAIRPTNVNVKSPEVAGKFKKDTERLYGLIWKRFVACQMSAAIYDETKIEVEATKKDKYLLRTSGRIMKFDGWRKVVPTGKDEAIQLPAVEEGEDLDLIKVLPEQKFTQPPARYNEASLIKTLEKLEIGRPSTYAPTISVIQERNYVEKKEKRFYPTAVGFAVNDFLVKNFPDVFEYSFTAGMEEELDKVAEGKTEWHKMMKDFYTPFSKKLGDVEKNAERVEIPTENLGEECPKCKEGEKVIRVGRYGKFISCSRFPDCDFTDRYLVKIGMDCPDCKDGEVIEKTTRRGRKFYGCSNYPKCKYASWKNPLEEKKKEDNQAESKGLVSS